VEEISDLVADEVEEDSEGSSNSKTSQPALPLDRRTPVGRARIIGAVDVVVEAEAGRLTQIAEEEVPRWDLILRALCFRPRHCRDWALAAVLLRTLSAVVADEVECSLELQDPVKRLLHTTRSDAVEQ
jgi:hypothetical protein